MPSNTSNTNKQSTSTSDSSTKASSNSSSGEKSQNQMIKDAGFSNMNRFMQSYNLKMHDDDDLREAKAILDGLRKVDGAGRKQ
ncbi:uncharacterized protein K444DRAFT_622882 [Hyaloscypha bicolor E]|uniref:Uncharacterized protein n=1 Tax=Hyaloscypha bicolor E TaxID=1095630 RepID=A0A2J6SEZ7_9HELO|nr:uncharacterized protein K444DRAFT_622882 [Hyaloscypha bicolor E]PMD49323.1 hypothetical protein K444DRAFT_622882 [Hyaloscypha bicolor E]